MIWSAVLAGPPALPPPLRHFKLAYAPASGNAENRPESTFDAFHSWSRHLTAEIALQGVACAPAGARQLRLLIVTDAWAPQVNGVVRTLETLGRDLTAMGHEVRSATPEGRFTVAMPTYPEIRLAVFPGRSLEATFGEFQPTAVHIATEGPLGWSARRICMKQRRAFTTSFHTRFPEYVSARFPFVSERLVYRWLRRFHGSASAVMVATETLRRDLEAHGFQNTRIWSRGVDVELFRPLLRPALSFQRPVWLYVGRVAVEKNIEAFLALSLPGTKVVVGEGPAREALQRKYPAAAFVGTKTGEALVRYYAGSDVFVFPSKTDTFGLVVLEALACGTPVAAFPVPGPADVIGSAPVGVLEDDLQAACKNALTISREACRAFALTRSWRACTEQFLANLPA